MPSNLRCRLFLLYGAVVVTFLQAAPAAAGGPITRTSAVIDPEIPASIRDEFDDDDGRPIKSIAVDLDGDGVPEKLVLNEFLCGNGGCPWLVYSVRTGKVIGRLHAATIAPLDTRSGGYRSLQTSTSLGAGQSESVRYVYRGNSYERQ